MSTNPTLPAGFFITSIQGKRCTAVPRASTTLTGSVATEAAAQLPTSTTSTVSTTAAASIDSVQAVTVALTSNSITSVATSLSTAIPQAQSEVTGSTTATPFTILNGGASTSSSTSSPLVLTTSTSTTTTSDTADSISSSGYSAAPIVGGVLGSLAFVSIVGALIWFILRRRRNRDSLLTPLGTSFYVGDDSPPKQGGRWNNEVGYQTGRLRSVATNIKENLVGFGVEVKAKLARHHSQVPEVNLNRGNSQFLDGPVSGHSRNNSLNSVHEAIREHHATVREQLADAFESIGDKIAAFRWGKSNNSNDTFLDAKQAGMNNISRSEKQDPFADPTLPYNTNTPTNPFADPTNPFSDPPTPPAPTAPKTNTYISDTRRSRGQSIDRTTTANNASSTASYYRPPSSLPGSRYPSTIAPSRDSYRDTTYTSFSNARNSDPFDLEVPALWRPNTESKMYTQPLNASPIIGTGAMRSNAKAQGVLGMDVEGQPGRRITYGSSSKYSSMGGLSEWGDPGPDVEPGSLGKESVLGGANEYGLGIYRAQQDEGGLRRMGSTGSKASSKNGVGKAW